jgi:hypothetical protein
MWLAGRRRLGPADAKRDVTLGQLFHRTGRQLSEAGSTGPSDVDTISVVP